MVQFWLCSQNTQFLLVQPFASFLIAQCHQNLHRPQQLMRCVSAPCWPACLKQRRTYIYSASVLFLFALHTYVAVQCKRNSNINNRNRKFLQRRLFFIFPQSLLCTAWLSPDKTHWVISCSWWKPHMIGISSFKNLYLFFSLCRILNSQLHLNRGDRGILWLNPGNGTRWVMFFSCTDSEQILC